MNGGAGSGPFGYSLSLDENETYQMHTMMIPFRLPGIDVSLTKWKTNTR